jgi:hypothetical protein
MQLVLVPTRSSCFILSFLLILHLDPYYLKYKYIFGQTNKQTPWSESASELYRPSDRRSDCQLLWIEGVTWSA